MIVQQIFIQLHQQCYNMATSAIFFPPKAGAQSAQITMEKNHKIKFSDLITLEKQSANQLLEEPKMMANFSSKTT